MEWENFARTILPAANFDVATLRDHANEILLATVRDMDTDQTAQDQQTKSTGHGVDSAHSRQLDSASSHHAISRVEAGFDVMQLVSEYRALRASVIRLWQGSQPVPDSRDLCDLTRFNESMDQSLAKAVKGYADRVEEARHTFLAILSHDLRSPLTAVLMSATVIQQASKEDEIRSLAGHMISSAVAMKEMIANLLQFAGTALGTRIQLARTTTDLLPLCQEVIEETRAGHPESELRFLTDGPTTGEWDRARVREVVTNLLCNAITHGATSGPIVLTLRGDAEMAHLSVHNQGEPIPPTLLPRIFQPLVRTRREGSRLGASGLGLGLAIIDRIVSAHGGAVEVTSTEAEGTTFTVHLPRTPPRGAPVRME